MSDESNQADRGDDFVPTDDAPVPAPVDEPKTEAPVQETEEAVEPATDEVDDDTPTVMIPKHRYDTAARLRREAEDRARRLESELESLRAQGGATKAAPDTTAASTSSDTTVSTLEAQLLDLDREIAKAAAEGETERQVELMSKARKLDRQLVSAQLEASVAERIRGVGPATIEDMRYDDMVAAAEHDHPQINPDAAEYDDAKATEVLELKEAFEARGSRPTVALEKALRYVFGELAAKQSKPAGEGRKTDVRKAAEAAGKLPPDITATGLDGDRAGMTTTMPVVEKLSDSDFAALPQDTLKRLRGDFV